MSFDDPKEVEYEKYICTECYEFGTHTEITYGNWIQYAARFALIFPFVAILSLIYFGFLFLMFVLARGKFIAIDTMDLFPLLAWLPEAPHTVKTCPHCKRVNTQAKVKDANGQTALHFHKRMGMNSRNEAVKKTEIKERKIDPEEF